jgi:hypothetical protein
MADIVLIRADDLNLYPVNNAIGTVVHAAERSNIDTVIIGGRIRKRDGVVLGLEQATLRALIDESCTHLFNAAGYEPDLFPRRSHRSTLPERRLMNAILLPIAFGAGIAVALQAALNGQLARGIGGDPLTASLVFFAIGALFLTIITMLRGGIAASLMQVPAQPLWTPLGGALGAGA